MAEWVVDRCGITHEIENRPILVLRACARHRQAGSSWQLALLVLVEA